MDNGRCLVPARFLCEHLDYSVLWNRDNQEINIFSNSGDMTLEGIMQLLSLIGIVSSVFIFLIKNDIGEFFSCEQVNTSRGFQIFVIVGFGFTALYIFNVFTSAREIRLN